MLLPLSVIIPVFNAGEPGFCAGKYCRAGHVPAQLEVIIAADDGRDYAFPADLAQFTAGPAPCLQIRAGATRNRGTALPVAT